MKICFICQANVCRSFISQEILKDLFKQNNETDVDIISRGTFVLEHLKVPEKIKNFLSKNNFPYQSHKPTQYGKDDIVSSDYIFVMTKEQFEELTDKYSQYYDKIFLLKQFVSNKEEDIEDPILFEGRKFDKTATNIKNLIINLYKKLVETKN